MLQGGEHHVYVVKGRESQNAKYDYIPQKLRRVISRPCDNIKQGYVEHFKLQIRPSPPDGVSIYSRIRLKQK